MKNPKHNCIDLIVYFLGMKYYKRHMAGAGMIIFCLIITPFFLEIWLILSLIYSKE